MQHYAVLRLRIADDVATRHTIEGLLERALRERLGETTAEYTPQRPEGGGGDATRKMSFTAGASRS